MTNLIPEKFHMSLFWYNRKQTILETARVCIEVLKIFHNIEPSSTRKWHILGFKKTLELDLCENNEELANTIALRYVAENLKEIHKYNKGSEITIGFSEPVGFIYTIASAKETGDRFYIQVQLGLYNTIVPNGFIVEFPKQKKITFPFAYALFKDLIQKLNPDHAFFSSRKISKLQKSNEFFVGWLSYFSNETKLPPIPSEYEVEQLDGIGKLLITTRDDFDSLNNPEHYAKAMRLVELFREHGIVRP